jgi:hypothetical protein
MKNRDFEAVESEIQKEKAEALGRTGDRLEQALQELKALQQELSDLLVSAEKCVREGRHRFSAEIDRRRVEYARLCEQARAWRHALIIQREAVGLWKHEDVDRQYPLPAPLPLPTTRGPEGDP